MNTNFSIDEADPSKDPILSELDQRSLNTSGLFTTVFKPLNDKQFLIFQGQADYNEIIHSLIFILSDSLNTVLLFCGEKDLMIDCNGRLVHQEPTEWVS
jgi:hypothetical protein